ncbi:MAG: hypothetical protein ACRBN8_19840 [Nannocystales bacterium]
MKASDIPQTVKDVLDANPDAVAFVAWLANRYPTNADPNDDPAVAELHEVGRVARGAVHGFIAKRHPGALQHDDPLHKGLVRGHLLSQAIAMYEAPKDAGSGTRHPFLEGLQRLVDAHVEEKKAAKAESTREQQESDRRQQEIDRQWLVGSDSQAARAARGPAIRPTVFWTVGDCTFATPEAAYRHLARHALSQALPARRLPKSWPALPKGAVQKVARLIRRRDESFGLGKVVGHA